MIVKVLIKNKKTSIYFGLWFYQVVLILISNLYWKLIIIVFRIYINLTFYYLKKFIFIFKIEKKKYINFYLIFKIIELFKFELHIIKFQIKINKN